MNGPFSYTGVPSPALNAELDRILKEIGGEIGRMQLPRLAGVVLGGGYGRGEGGVLHTPGGDRLYNDLDFFVFGDHAGKADVQNITSALGTVSERWKERLGIEVDFGPVKNLTALRKVSSTLMYQELRRGWRPVWGEADPEQWIPALEPAAIPFSEAVRLLVNRGMGLIFAGERLARKSQEADFIVRNMNKTVLGCGDALLLAAGKYAWKCSERTIAFDRYAEENRLPAEYAEAYRNAVRYKLEPVPVLPEDPAKEWRFCRRFFLDTVRRTAGTADIADGLHRRAAGERSLKNLLRWLLKARTFRPLRKLCDPPVVPVLETIWALLAAGEDLPVCPEKLYRLWTRFN